MGRDFPRGVLVLWALGSKEPAMLLLLLGYASLIVFDVRAASISPACGRSRC